MNEMIIHAGERLHEVYVAGSREIPQRIVLERDAKADVVIAVMPGTSVDVRIEVELVGEGAEANLYGAYMCGDAEKVKIAVDMYHKNPHCNSRQLFKGIAGGSSRVDFYGKIIVAQDAQRTEAFQENHNILLSDGHEEEVVRTETAEFFKLVCLCSSYNEHHVVRSRDFHHFLHHCLIKRLSVFLRILELVC